MIKRFLVITALTAVAVGCEKKDDPAYTGDDVARYKAALPKSDTLNAPVVGGAAFQSTAAQSAGAVQAVYPVFAYQIATAVNGLIGGTIGIIEAVAETEPSLYDSEEKSFLWGPFPADDTAVADDHFTLIIDDNDGETDYDPSNGDLRYEFAIIRGLGSDVAMNEVIIAGVASPSEANPEHGIGAMIYDFDNNVAFEDMHNPGHGPMTTGRFATLFAKGPDENDPEAEVTFVVVAFRDFVPEDEPAADPANVDYFWGHYSKDPVNYAFLDLGFAADTDDAGALKEDHALKVAHIDVGSAAGGRAEVTYSGGDIPDPDYYLVDECWDMSINRNYIGVSVSTDGAAAYVVAEEGLESQCVFDDAGMATVPDIGDENIAGLIDALADYADAGIP